MTTADLLDGIEGGKVVHVSATTYAALEKLAAKVGQPVDALCEAILPGVVRYSDVDAYIDDYGREGLLVIVGTYSVGVVYPSEQEVSGEQHLRGD